VARCPSQDWDDKVRSEDKQAAEEVAWWDENQDRVLMITAAILSNPNVEPLTASGLAIVEIATAIVIRVTRNAEPA
jgi:hypothetical protein